MPNIGMKKESYNKLLAVSIFALAMGFLEAIIVVYLRKIYYPNGFDFPLVSTIEQWVLNMEWAREFFTIVMLLCIGILAGKKFYERFAYFLYAFAVWDIFYYIWLKVILGWPASLMTWDLLFLIPYPWASPVIAPVVYSIDIILLALVLIQSQDRNGRVKIKFLEWALFVAGSAFILYTFLYDYGKLILKYEGQGFLDAVAVYVPMNYNWVLLAIGEILILASIYLIWKNEGSKNV